MIVNFLHFLSNLAYPDKNPTQPRPEFSGKPDCLRFPLGGYLITSVNDGSGWKMRFSRSGNQWVPTGKVPLITIEARPKLHPFSLINRQKGIFIECTPKRSLHRN